MQTLSNPPADKILLTIEETIKATNSSRATIYREINAERLKTVKLGRRRYVTPAAIEEWIALLGEQSEEEK